MIVSCKDNYNGKVVSESDEPVQGIRKTFDGKVSRVYDEKGRVVEIFGHHPDYEDFDDPFRIRISYDSLNREVIREDFRYVDTTFKDTSLYYVTEYFYKGDDKDHFKKKVTTFKRTGKGNFRKSVKEIYKRRN